MNPHADATGQNAHRAAQEALPWMLNGSLDGAELDSVETHLQGCPVCRDDLEMLRALRDAGPPCPDPALDPGRALARMLPRLDAPEAAPRRSDAAPGLLQRWRASVAANERTWLRSAVLGQCALIAGLLVAQMWPGTPSTGQYRVLGAQARQQATLIIVFSPDTTERELRRIVRDSGVRFVDGPTTTDAYLVSADNAAAALTRLRAEPAVTLAEPLTQERQP